MLILGFISASVTVGTPFLVLMAGEAAFRAARLIHLIAELLEFAVQFGFRLSPYPIHAVIEFLLHELVVGFVFGEWETHFT